MLIRRSVGAAAILLTFTQLAAAQATYTAQTRMARAALLSGGGEGPFLSMSAIGFGSFDQAPYVQDMGWQCNARAIHESSLLPDGIACDLESLPTDGIQWYGGRAEAIADITFTLAETTPYLLTGTWAASAGWSMSAIAYAKLTGPSGVIFDQGHHNPSEPWFTNPLDASGTLEPGEYHFYARVYGQAQHLGGGDSANAKIDLHLLFNPPSECPADLDGDGLVDFADYLEFLNLFYAADPRVDFTTDGIVDFSDYLEFLSLFDAGC